MSVVHTAACIALGYAWPRPVCVCGLQAARVYTAGPDGRCTVCQRPEAEHAPEAWGADARACPTTTCTVCNGPVDDGGECRCPTCSTCDGAGIVRDAKTGGLRRCSSCRGSGETDGLHAGFPPGGLWSANGDHVPRTVMPADQTDAKPVIAETVTDVIDSQIRALRASVCDAANGQHSDAATAAHRVWHDCNRALGEGGYERDDQARVRVAAAINARAKGGR